MLLLVPQGQKELGMGTSPMLVSPWSPVDIAGWLLEIGGCWLVTVLHAA